MSSTGPKNEICSGHPRVDGLYHTAEWLLSAFTGVLVFIVFVMQVYRIPTGSMAPTLRGAHFRVRCAECGYAYGHDFIARNYNLPDTVTPAKKQLILHKIPTRPGMPEQFIASQCPNCGYREPETFYDKTRGFYTIENNRFRPPRWRTVFKGDQIFVLKSVYQFFKPKRWDVIVFKNPIDPKINYIKRCIGLPGETIQIVDGDVYADGVIQRKPDKVQDELWMIVYDNDHQPVHPQQPRFYEQSWRQPFEQGDDAAWDLSAEGPTVFALDAQDDRTHRLLYNDERAGNFLATYAYDDPRSYDRMPVCSDLMLQYHLTMAPDAAAGGQIRKYGIDYQGWVYADGRMQISRLRPNAEPVIVENGRCDPEILTDNIRFRFATLDHQVILQCGSTRLVHEMGTGMEIEGDHNADPQVQIAGAGKLRLEHIAVYRDIHYISEARRMGTEELRGSLENPMVLQEEQYFACGDNSPFSADSRVWGIEGIGNNGKTYPKGVVPKEYLVGKGLLVHWPGGYRIWQEPIRWIPNVDDMKIIYGGKADSADNKTD